jgi:hypothetical protein
MLSGSTARLKAYVGIAEQPGEKLQVPTPRPGKASYGLSTVYNCTISGAVTEPTTLPAIGFAANLLGAKKYSILTVPVHLGTVNPWLAADVGTGFQAYRSNLPIIGASPNAGGWARAPEHDFTIPNATTAAVPWLKIADRNVLEGNGWLTWIPGQGGSFGPSAPSEGTGVLQTYDIFVEVLT